MSNELSRIATLEVKENKYELKFPTMGNFLDIESRRMALSNGTYSQLLRSALISSGIALDMIDMAATLSVLCPKLIKDLKAESLLDLDIMDAQELENAYKKSVKPWVEGWLKIIREARKEDIAQNADVKADA